MKESASAIKHLLDNLSQLDYVNSVVIRGSVARNKEDQYSDLDLSIGVNEKKNEEALNAVGDILKQIAPLDLEYENVPGTNRTFHLEGYSSFFIFDIATWTYEENSYGTGSVPQDFGAKIMFDRFNRLEIVDSIPPQKEIDIFLQKTESELHPAFLSSRVYKYIRRGKYISAIRAYNTYLIRPWARILRLRYSPETWKQELYGIDSALPEDILNIFIPLLTTSTIEEIEAKSKEVEKLLRAELNALKS